MLNKYQRKTNIWVEESNFICFKTYSTHVRYLSVQCMSKTVQTLLEFLWYEIELSARGNFKIYDLVLSIFST